MIWVRLREAVIAHFHTFVQESRTCVKPLLSGTSYSSFVHLMMAMQRKKDRTGTMRAKIPFYNSEGNMGN
jgi:hypothetical protein